MKKTLLIHDLAEEELKTLHLDSEHTIIFYADGRYAPCQGCFGCWLKTPGKCVMKDALQNIATQMASSDEVIFISRNCYGGLAPEVKNVVDRSIATSLPFFTYRDKRIHHSLRYKKKVDLTICLYGDMTAHEKEVAQKLTHANEVNGGYRSSRLLIAEDAAQIKEVLL